MNIISIETKNIEIFFKKYSVAQFCCKINN